MSKEKKNPLKRLKSYRVEQYETWTQGYVVEATSPQEAAKIIMEGSGGIVDDTSFEYIEPNEDLGFIIDGENYPSIRSVVED